jgi:uncharacterized membrane protein
MQAQRYWQTAIASCLALYILLLTYSVIYPILRWPSSPILMPAATLSLFSFTIGHSIWSLGEHRALAFLGVAFGISLLFEMVGVLTGWVYGPYYYTEQLGIKLFELVPALIPLAWFMMIYPAHVLVERVAMAKHKRGWVSAVWLAGLSAMAVSAWDLLMDPLMVADGNWVWQVKGDYFGIPVHNYVGWLATTFCIYLVYRMVAVRLVACPWEDNPIWFQDLPVWAYVATWLGIAAVAVEKGMPGVALAGFFGMGSFALLGLGTILTFPRKSSHRDKREGTVS